MIARWVLMTAALAAALLAGTPAPRAAAGDNELPKTPAEALAAATPFLEAARKAKSAETPEIAKGARRAVDLMQPHVAKGAKDAAWATAWNEALTLSRFHGNKPTGEYAMTPRKILGDAVVVGLPTGRGWEWVDGQFGPNAQCRGEFRRVLADGSTASAVRVSAYSFNALYSGVGGENAAGLAEIFFGIYRGSMTKIESRSPKIVAKPLSAEFKRANHFEIVGTLEKEGAVRIRAYFVKAPTRTYEFDAIEYRGVKPEDAPLDVWQRTKQDPELEAVLESIGEPKE
jgi:hypothetical protein